MVYATPHSDDQLATWCRWQAEDTAHSINICLPLGLARRLRVSAACVMTTATEEPPTAVDPRPGSLRDLRIIHLHEGRDGEPRHLATADKGTVLHILRADLAWLEDSHRQVPQK